MDRNAHHNSCTVNATKVGNGICELVSRQERVLSSDGMFSEAPVNVVKLIEKGLEVLNLGKGLLVLALTKSSLQSLLRKPGRFRFQPSVAFETDSPGLDIRIATFQMRFILESSREKENWLCMGRQSEATTKRAITSHSNHRCVCNECACPKGSTIADHNGLPAPSRSSQTDHLNGSRNSHWPPTSTEACT